MKKKVTFEISEETSEKLEKIRKTLQERGVKKVNLSSLIDRLVSKLNQKETDNFINTQTPLEWSVEAMLNDPLTRKDVEKFVLSSRKKLEKATIQKAIRGEL